MGERDRERGKEGETGGETEEEKGGVKERVLTTRYRNKQPWFVHVKAELPNSLFHLLKKMLGIKSITGNISIQLCFKATTTLTLTLKMNHEKIRLS